jgi:aminomethyltransferase
VKLEREDFAGRDALLRLSATERRRTVGLLPEGSGSIARHGARVSVGGVPAGEVTSGTFSFTLERPIATAILELPPTGARVEVEVRGRPVPAGVTSLPFVGP